MRLFKLATLYSVLVFGGGVLLSMLRDLAGIWQDPLLVDLALGLVILFVLIPVAALSTKALSRDIMGDVAWIGIGMLAGGLLVAADFALRAVSGGELLLPVGARDMANPITYCFTLLVFGAMPWFVARWRPGLYGRGAAVFFIALGLLAVEGCAASIKRGARSYRPRYSWEAGECAAIVVRILRFPLGSLVDELTVDVPWNAKSNRPPTTWVEKSEPWTSERWERPKDRLLNVARILNSLLWAVLLVLLAPRGFRLIHEWPTRVRDPDSWRDARRTFAQGLILALLVLIPLTLAYWYVRGSHSRFDAERWQITGSDPEWRWRMREDLCDNHLRRGMTVDEVRRLLGTSMDAGTAMHFYLRPNGESLPYNLALMFDAHGKLTGYRILKDDEVLRSHDFK